MNLNKRVFLKLFNTYLNKSIEGLIVRLPKLLFDEFHVDLTPSDHDADQLMVIGPETLPGEHDEQVF